MSTLENMPENMPDKLITVSVKLTGMIRSPRCSESANGELVPVQLQVGSTVGDLLDKMEIARDKAKLVFVNHTKQTLDDTLVDGARVEIFPIIAGG